jgi:hypothetical protein
MAKVRSYVLPTRSQLHLDIVGTVYHLVILYIYIYVPTSLENLLYILQTIVPD